MENGLLAEVLVDVAARKIDQCFHYSVPGELAGKLRVGSKVLVPFNRRRVTGFVTGLDPTPATLSPGLEMKDILEILDEGPVFTPGQLDLARWMAQYYQCATVSALQSVIWPRIKGTAPKKGEGNLSGGCCR